ncbi:hypothetical protein CB1_001109035, partial [Camelus ferus]
INSDENIVKLSPLSAEASEADVPGRNGTAPSNSCGYFLPSTSIDFLPGLLATLKNGQEACLNPAAPMVKKIISKMLNKATLKNGQEACLNPAAPLVKKIVDKMLNKSPVKRKRDDQGRHEQIRWTCTQNSKLELKEICSVGHKTYTCTEPPSQCPNTADTEEEREERFLNISPVHITLRGLWLTSDSSII